MEFRKIKESEIKELSLYARGIIKEHFDPLIGIRQNDYMIEKLQSISSIKNQFEYGSLYYWAMDDSYDIVGFFDILPKGNKLYLSKFYVEKKYRGKGFGSGMMDFILDYAKRHNYESVYLNCYRNNTMTIEIYKHLGFQIIREEKNDIGEGFIADDYVLEYKL